MRYYSHSTNGFEDRVKGAFSVVLEGEDLSVSDFTFDVEESSGRTLVRVWYGDEYFAMPESEKIRSSKMLQKEVERQIRLLTE